MRTELEDIALEQLHCPYCAAEPGYWCVTTRVNFPWNGRQPGVLASYLHASRTRALREAWRIGYGAGLDEGRYQEQRRQASIPQVRLGDDGHVRVMSAS